MTTKNKEPVKRANKQNIHTDIELIPKNEIDIQESIEITEVKRSEKPKLPEIEQEKSEEPKMQIVKYKKTIYMRKPKKKIFGSGMEYYYNKRDEILKQKKEYYEKNKGKRQEYQSQWYHKKKEEEYIKEHGNLDGFEIREYNKSKK